MISTTEKNQRLAARVLLMIAGLFESAENLLKAKESLPYLSDYILHKKRNEDENVAQQED